MANLSVRELQAGDIDALVRYWHDSDPDFLRGMGVDLSKIPPREALAGMLSQQLTQDYPEKQSYGIIWELDGVAVGHSNVNKIIFGEEAYMHLHLWQSDNRQKGLGTAFVRLTLPYFFKNMRLQCLRCEPYALNPAPNKTLEKVGFRLEKTYVTVPGYLNFEQMVNHWVLDRDEE